jgi:hypothetical protein
MLPRDIHKNWRRLMVSGTFLSTTFTALIYAGLESDQSRLSPPILVRFVDFSHVHGFWVIPILLLLTSLLSWATIYVGPKHHWRIIESILGQQRKLLFDSMEEPEHNHKVTLFEWKRGVWYLPWTYFYEAGYLVAVARYGDRRRGRIPRFNASKETGDAKGVVGLAWQYRREQYVQSLPNLNADHPSEADFKRYAARTNSSLEWVRKRWDKCRRENRATALSYLAVPIDINGRTWGVVVIDSTSPDEIPGRGPNRQQFKLLINVLTDALDEHSS